MKTISRATLLEFGAHVLPGVSLGTLVIERRRPTIQLAFLRVTERQRVVLKRDRGS
jgi:hypothetical protein